MVQSVWLQMTKNPMADSMVQSVWLQMTKNPMVDSLVQSVWLQMAWNPMADSLVPVSYTHLRAHETSLHLVCRLLLEKKK